MMSKFPRRKCVAAVLSAAALVLTVLSASAPMLAFQAQDLALFNSAHPQPAENCRLSPEANDFHLVQAVRSLYSETADSTQYFNAGVRTDELSTEEIRTLFDEQVDTMQRAGTFGQEIAERLKATPPEMVGWPENRLLISNRDGQLLTQSYADPPMDNGRFYWNLSCGIQRDRTGVLQFHTKFTEENGPNPYREIPHVILDPKTGKVLALFCKSYSIQLEPSQRQEVAEGFAVYLGLDVIGDWHWVDTDYGSVYRSDEAGLSIHTCDGGVGLCLSIGPAGPEEANGNPLTAKIAC